jgi:hypothetical protein
VSLDVILLGESQRVPEIDLTDINKLQQLNNNFNCKGLRYVALFSAFFRYPIYGIMDQDRTFKVFVNQAFKEKNEYNLKNLLISLFEFTSEVLNVDDQDEVKLLIYLKRECFEAESKLLIRNLNWLGGKLVQNDIDDTNKYNCWYIMEFEV